MNELSDANCQTDWQYHTLQIGVRALQTSTKNISKNSNLLFLSKSSFYVMWLGFSPGRPSLSFDAFLLCSDSALRMEGSGLALIFPLSASAHSSVVEGRAGVWWVVKCFVAGEDEPENLSSKRERLSSPRLRALGDA